jgi:N-methylhydantoinase A
MKPRQQFQIGIDIGGTFTDFSLVDQDSKRLKVHKCLTIPEDLLASVRSGIEYLLATAEIDLSQVSRINHASTLVANALLERKGDVTGLLCTRGFSSVFDIGLEQRYDQYDLRIEFPKPLVPLALRKEINERINSRGEIEKALVDQEIVTLVKELRDQHQITSLAVCFINSYRNPVHERRVKDILSGEFPDLSVSTSADVLPAIREYERWTTTVINAYTQSILLSYLSDFDRWLREAGFAGSLYLLVSDGGMVSVDIARQYPVRMLASGSAASVLTSRHVSLTYNDSDLLMFDMGGTTTKLGIVSDGSAHKQYKLEVGRAYQNKKGSGFPVSIPAFDQTEIASGGCSIASIDQRGVLQVGPQSMGAKPGPACFGLGGEMPTGVDANLLLGHYGTDTFLGGEILTDPGRAEKAITSLSKKLDTSALHTAWGIYEMQNEKILATVKTHCAERGIDYRLCQMVVTGGAAPAHAMTIARKLGIKKVIIPPAPGVASAVGLLRAAISFETLRSYRIGLKELSPVNFESQFLELEKNVMAVVAQGEYETKDFKIIRRLDMRYLGQGFELNIDLPADLELPDVYTSLAELFNRTYEQVYFSSFPERDVEIIGWKVEMVALESNALDNYIFDAYQKNLTSLFAKRKVYSFEDEHFHEWPVYNRYALLAGQKLVGPALIEDKVSTAVFHNGDEIEVDDQLNIIASPSLSLS